MNIFYAPPEQVHANTIELRDQEAIHATKALRYSVGDDITVVDGRGSRYDGIVRRTEKKSVHIEITDTQTIARPKPRLILGLGIIKKRDRLEFAVEKAVELGVSEILLFRSKHTVKQNVRMDRLEATAISAMKQSLRAWLPSIMLLPSLQSLLSQNKAKVLVAHEKVDEPSFKTTEYDLDNELLLLVGPEGGFSEKEVMMVEKVGGEKVSLGKHRLRAETAAIAFLSKFI